MLQLVVHGHNARIVQCGWTAGAAAYAHCCAETPYSGVKLPLMFRCQDMMERVTASKVTRAGRRSGGSGWTGSWKHRGRNGKRMLRSAERRRQQICSGAASSAKSSSSRSSVGSSSKSSDSGSSRGPGGVIVCGV